jgi:hypothetical protein
MLSILYGDASGLTDLNNRAITQDDPEMEDQCERDDFFGSSMTSVDFNGDGYSDLGIGIPDEDLGDAIDARTFEVIYGTAEGLSCTTIADQFFTQDTPGMPGTVDEDDKFGVSLAGGDFNGDGHDDLTIGIPNESLETAEQAGAVTRIQAASPVMLRSIITLEKRWL